MSSSSSSRSSSASSSSIYHPNYDYDADDLLEANHLAAIAAVNEAVKLIVGDEATSSRQTRRTPKSRNRIVAHEKLVNDYFSDNPVYDDNNFERRFHMTRRLFLKIVEDLEREYEFFRWTHDARGVKGFSPLQKCTSAIRQLAYGTAADATDEYLQMSETTSRECFTNFCEGIIHLYMRRYLRKPTANDVQLLFALHEQQHGLPGMLGSIDCMHWDWKNCPVAWRGQYHRGDHQGPTTVLEAVASYDGWIWHAYYGTPGAVNDIVVVNQSPIFNDLFEGKAPDSSFSVNGRQYKHGYYLADGIYPKWTTFVKAYRYPTEPERIAFTERQESARKDIERAFAMLKSKWHIVKYPARAWTKKKLRYTMYTCIILHNMIREDEGFANYPFDESWVTTDDTEVDISEEERAQNVNEVEDEEYLYEDYSSYFNPSTISSPDQHHPQSPPNFTILTLLFKSLVTCTAAANNDQDATSSSSSSSISSSFDLDIGCPTDVHHLSHVTFDPFNGFLGLPLDLQPHLPPKPPSASIRVFGVSAESMQCSYDERGNSVPTILLMMQKRLYSEGGLQAEGIFRINAENSEEEDVRKQLNRGFVPHGIDVHCLAGLIKAWFRELPRGVLDCLRPEQVMHCNTEEECSRLVESLPQTEAALLDWAINLMADVVTYESLNKMNARNIAMVFAPNMTQMADPLTALIHAVQVMNFLKTLVMKTLDGRKDLDRYGDRCKLQHSRSLTLGTRVVGGDEKEDQFWRKSGSFNSNNESSSKEEEEESSRGGGLLERLSLSKGVIRKLCRFKKKTCSSNDGINVVVALDAKGCA
ncbi:hypothetical protein OSB04_031784 [Centaurea solstitialis]|uniref:Rho-GAP domain-containing protein n=1 Tax=Centaurea solstitialis TaxID=347529 RepID=A0AA38SMC1_9ASTR|nr:hypothetical protein OSB04_031784 [Centaurea solstitialis]